MEPPTWAMVTPKRRDRSPEGGKGERISRSCPFSRCETLDIRAAYFYKIDVTALSPSDRSEEHQEPGSSLTVRAPVFLLDVAAIEPRCRS